MYWGIDVQYNLVQEPGINMMTAKIFNELSFVLERCTCMQQIHKLYMSLLTLVICGMESRYSHVPVVLYSVWFYGSVLLFPLCCYVDLI